MARGRSGLRAIIWVGFAFVLLHQAGCFGLCRGTQGGYEEALSREVGLLEGPAVKEQSEAHFVIGISGRFLSATANEVISHALEEAMASPSKSEGEAGGLGLVLRPNVGPVRIRPDKACASCIRMDADLGGRLEVVLPLLGRQGGELGGRISFVTPVLIEGEGDGALALRLDPARGSALEKPRLRLDLGWLPARWAGVVEERLARLIQVAIFERFGPVRLARFEAPDLGVHGLELFPLGIETDEDSDEIRLMLASNLDVSPGGAGGKMPSLAGGDLLVAVRSDLMAAMLQRLLQDGTIPRRYTIQGQPDPRGRVHVTVRDFYLEELSGPGADVGLNLGFDLWSFGRWGACFSVAGAARGRVSLTGESLGVEIDEVSFSDSTLASSANWAASRFLGEGSREVLREALQGNVPVMGGVSLRLSGQSVSEQSGYVVLNATGQVEKLRALP